MRRCNGLALIIALWVITGILHADSLPSCPLEGTESPVTVTCSFLGNDAISVSLQVAQFDLQKTDTYEAGRDLILVDGEPGLEVEDRPVLPFIARSVLIPPTGSVTLRLDNVVYDSRRDLTPVQARLDDNLAQSGSDLPLSLAQSLRASAESPEGFWPASPVEIGEAAILRGYRIVNFRVYPVQYNAATGETRFNRQIQFHLEVPGADQQVWDLPPRLKSINAWRVVSSLVENPPPAPQRDDLLHANYLFIVPEVEQIDDTIAPLVEWRARQGHNVQVAHVPNNQNRAEVHAAIQAAYNSEYPVEYVALVGDAANSPFVVEASSDNGDYAYTTIDGNDPLPDVAIGRISADTFEMLAQIVNKLVSYETAPYMEETDWFKQGAVVAGHVNNGLSTVLLAKYVRKELLAMGFTEVRHWYHNEDGEIPVGRPQPFLTNCFEWGISVLHYRAYQAMNRLPINEIDNLPNRRGRWPAVLAISCNTGDFVAGTDGQTEAFLRARGGGIGAIGTATPGSVPQYNNIVSGGVWKGIYKDKLFNMGWGLVSGKFELWRAYNGHNDRYLDFMEWNNLMGDPGTILWSDVPRAIEVEHLENLALGGSYVSAHVTDAESGEDEPEALVCLYKQGELHLTRYTDENGTATFAIDPEALSEGDLMITVTKHNVYPYLGNIAVASAELYFGVTSAFVNDAQGNNDGALNPSEEVELRLSISNLGTQGAGERITIRAESLSPGAEIDDQPVVINNAPAPGESVTASFTTTVDPSCPDQTEVQVRVTVTNQENTWISMTALMVNSPRLAVARLPLDGAQLAPGGSYDNYNIEFINRGHAPLGNSRVTMTEPRDFLDIRVAEAAYDVFDVDQQHGAGAGGFSFDISPLVMPGTPLDLTFYIESEEGFRDTTTARLTVGVVADGGPIGPDAYGYYCFDSGDVDYSMAPQFEWIEINPAIEGFDFQGTNLNLQDPADNQDRSVVVNLPFPFQYYGESFDRITICTNGWAAFGDQAELADFRNRQIGQALGPNAQLAVWWDNLQTVQGSAILTHYDADAGRFIIEWSGMRRLVEGGNGAAETFEIILFNPEMVPTASGDGIIKYQYLDVTNENRTARNDTPYCTIGISNLDDSDGLQYTYYNVYPTGARPIESNMALTFSTATAYITGAVQGRVLDLATGNPIPNAVVTSRGVWSQTDADGRYFLELLIGDNYAVTASVAGWNDSTQTGFSIAEDETLTVDFHLLFSSLSLSTDHITDQMGINQTHHHTLTIHNDGNGPLTWTSEQSYSQGETGIGQRINTQILANVVNDLTLEGVVWAEDHYFITGQNGQMDNLIYVLDENFQEVNRFSQSGSSRDGMKDITYGNGLLWGSGERNITAFSTDGDLVHQFPGPYSPNQALAFDSDRELLWVWAANGAIVAVDLNGNRVTQFPPPRLNITGMAYWPDDPDGCNLYMVEDPRNDHQDVYRMNMTNGEIESVSSLDPKQIGQSGGIHIAGGYGIYGTVLMILVNDYLNQRGDRLDVWQMGTYKGWLTLDVTEGVVAPQADRDLDVALCSMGLFPAVYRAQLLFRHSGMGGNVTVPVELTVDDRAAPPETLAPVRFDFESAYPNPFNAAVSLSYTLPAPADVRLVVYDLAGRVTREIVNTHQGAGRHRVDFDAVDLPSGIYLAWLTTGGETRLMKLACIK